GLLIAIGVIVVGFILMRLVMNIQRISPHQMVGVPQPPVAQSAPPQQQAPAPQTVPRQPPPAQAPTASVAPVVQAPSRAPSSPPPAVVEVPKKSPPPVAIVAPSIPLPNAFVPAFANANAAAKASAAAKKE